MMVAYFVAAMIGGMVCAFLAADKNRNALGWFVIGFLLPLVGIILVIVLPNEQPPASTTQTPRVPGQSSYVDDLAKLADLRDRNVLTAEEFEEKKRLVLDRANNAPRSRERASEPGAEPGSSEMDDAEAKALLAKAHEHHYSKRWEDAKREYQELVSRFPSTKQAALARQQLINLKAT